MPLASPFTADGGVPMPLFRTDYGKTRTIAVTTTAGAAVQAFTDGFARPIRIWAVGCPLIYVTGAAGVAAPAATDGYVAQDQRLEIYLTPDESYIRIAAASGTGTAKVEVLR